MRSNISLYQIATNEVQFNTYKQVEVEEADKTKYLAALEGKGWVKLEEVRGTDDSPFSQAKEKAVREVLFNTDKKIEVKGKRGGLRVRLAETKGKGK